MTRSLPLCRSILFVPANRPDRYDKAFTSGADIVCVDVEDAVLPDDKAAARALAIPYVTDFSSTSVCRKALRINAIDTEFGIHDLAVLLNESRLPEVLLLPKVEHARDLDILSRLFGERLSETHVLALLETAEGLANAYEIAAHPACAALMFGSADWSAECGATMAWHSLLTARAMIVQAAARAGIAAIDGAWLDFNDEAGLRRETLRIKEMGFAGKPVLHPKQLAAVHGAFQPDAQELAFANKVLSAADSSRDGVLLVDGRMIDKPVVQAARNTVRLASAYTEEEL
jgi:citrate lyase beta subunit